MAGGVVIFLPKHPGVYLCFDDDLCPGRLGQKNIYDKFALQVDF